MKDSRQVILLNLDDILPNRFQPRIKFDEKAIVELSESIKEHGVIQPIIVRKVSDKYEIIAGERRYKASVMAGKTNIPAIIVSLNDKDSSEIALIENVQRQDLTPIEEAISYRKILDMGYLTQETLASKLGVAQPTIANKLRLLNLDDEVQEALLDGKISERHARSLLKLTKASMQREMLKKIIDEKLTVRKTDEVISDMLKNNESSVFDSIEKNNINNFEQPINSVDNSGSNPFIIDNSNNNTVEDNNVEVLDFGFEEIRPIEVSTIPDDDNNISQPTTNEAPVSDLASSVFNSAPAMSENIVSETQTVNQNTISNQTIETNPINDVKPRFFTMVQPQFEDETNEVTPNDVFNKPIEVENSYDPISSQPEDNEQPENTAQNIFSQQPIVYPETNDENIVNPAIVNPNIAAPINNVSFVPNSNGIVDDSAAPIMPTELNNDAYEEATGDSSEEQVTYFPSLREIISKIRKCADEIEASGFGIDTEEYDLDDIYQVIFKIKK